MKIKTGKDELKVIDFHDKQDEGVWDKIGRYLTYGIPAYDKKGHTTEFRFKAQRIARDMAAEIQSKMPDGYFKTQAHLYRGIFATGCVVALHWIRSRSDKDVRHLTAILDFLNMIAKEERLEEIKHELKIAKMKILEQGDSASAQRLKLLDEYMKIVNEINK